MFQKVFKLFDIPDDKQVEIVKIVLHSLVATEFKSYNGDINGILNHKQMMTLCVNKLGDRLSDITYLQMIINFNDYLKILMKQLEYWKLINILQIF